MLLFKRSIQWQFTERCRFKWSVCVFSWKVWISKKKTVHQTIPWSIHIRMHLSIASCARVIQIEKKIKKIKMNSWVCREESQGDGPQHNNDSENRYCLWQIHLFNERKKKRTIAFSIIIAFWFSLQPGYVQRVRALCVRKHEVCNAAVRMTKTTSLAQASMK